MRLGQKSVDGTSDSLSSSGILVALVLALGATVYLRRAGYVRRKTFYVLIAAELIGIAVLAYFIRQGAT